MKRLLTSFALGWSIVASVSTIAQDAPDIILVTNQTVQVYRKVSTQSTTNTPRLKGVRQWKKQCPFCKNDCISTNASSWIVNGQDGEPEMRFTTVSFTCTHTDCGERFRHTIELKLPKTAIEELPPTP